MQIDLYVILFFPSFDINANKTRY